MVVRLSEKTLSSISPEVKRPSYDRRALSEGVVHFGVGNFHRSHQALYLDECLEQGAESTWGICGVGILPSDRLVHEALSRQDCLYSLVERSSERSSARVIGSITRHLLAPDDPEAVFEMIAAPSTKIVSLTITEGGYFVKDTAALDLEQADVRHDLERRSPPHTVYGYLAEGLERRRRRDALPLTVVSCDNLDDNGRVIQRGLVDFAGALSAELGRWIERCVRFPSSMVDRITPAATRADQAFLISTYGIEDACPVTCEPFRQWVLEDDFAHGRPALESAGVQFTSDVKPYQTAKIRLLNATHSALGYLGYLAGYRFVHEVARAPEFSDYVTRLMDDEVTPLLRSLPGLDLEDYKRSLRQRFANRALVDPLLRICAEGSTKIPKFVLPSIREELARHGPIQSLCLCVAAWLRFLWGVDERGTIIPLQDRGAGRLVALVRRSQTEVRAALALPEIFGDLAQSSRFTDEVAKLYATLCAQGARNTLLALGVTNP